MPARKRTAPLSETWKQKIRLTKLMQRLEACAQGEIKMENCSIKSAEIILRKLVPDLQKTDHSLDPSANKMIVEIRTFSDKLKSP